MSCNFQRSPIAIPIRIQLVDGDAVYAFSAQPNVIVRPTERDQAGDAPQSAASLPPAETTPLSYPPMESPSPPASPLSLNAATDPTHDPPAANRNSRHRRDLIEDLRKFITTNGSEFLDAARGRKGRSSQSMDMAPGLLTRMKGGEFEFSFLPDQLARLYPKTRRRARLLKQLRKRGLLIHDGQGSGGSTRNTTKRMIGTERRRVYCVSQDILNHRPKKATPSTGR